MKAGLEAYAKGPICTESEHDVGSHSMTAVYAWCYGDGGLVSGYVCQACYNKISDDMKSTDYELGRLFSFVRIADVVSH